MVCVWIGRSTIYVVNYLYNITQINHLNSNFPFQIDSYRKIMTLTEAHTNRLSQRVRKCQKKPNHTQTFFIWLQFNAYSGCTSKNIQTTTISNQTRNFSIARLKASKAIEKNKRPISYCSPSQPHDIKYIFFAVQLCAFAICVLLAFILFTQSLPSQKLQVIGVQGHSWHSYEFVWYFGKSNGIIQYILYIMCRICDQKLRLNARYNWFNEFSNEEKGWSNGIWWAEIDYYEWSWVREKENKNFKGR